MEGLWSATYKTALGEGAGIIIFESQRVFGGDASRTYIGNYIIRNAQIDAEIRIASFLMNPGESVFGDVRDFDLVVGGHLPSSFPIESKIVLKGHVKDTNEQILITLIKRAELP